MRRRRGLELLVAACFFLEIFDATVVTTAAPRLADDLHVSLPSAGLLVTAYLTTAACAMPASSWLGARHGPRRVLCVAIAIFLLGSIGCAAATSFPELVAMRVLQGAGGALMVPVGRLAVLAGRPKADVMRTVGFLVWPGLLAPVLAPPVAGVVIEAVGWRPLFLLGVPPALVALLTARRIVPGTPGGECGRFDWAGLILGGGALTCLIGAAQELEARGVPWALVSALAGSAALLAGLTGRHLIQTREPLVDLRVLQVGTVRMSLSAAAGLWVTVGAVPFLLSILMQVGLGWTAARSGVVLAALFAGNLGIKPATRPLYRRYGFRGPLLGSCLMLAATTVACAAITREWSPVFVGVLVAAGGAARSVALTGCSTLAFADVDGRRMADTNVLFLLVQQLGAGLGVAVAALALRAGDLVAVGSGPSRPAAAGLLLLGVWALLPALGCARIPRSAGATLSA